MAFVFCNVIEPPLKEIVLRFAVPTAEMMLKGALVKVAEVIANVPDVKFTALFEKLIQWAETSVSVNCHVFVLETTEANVALPPEKVP